MRAGGGWLRSAFYGGRIASAMTIGLAAKGIKAIASRKKGGSSNGNSSGDSSDGSDDSGDKYTEDSAESTDAADESTAAQTQGGESS